MIVDPILVRDVLSLRHNIFGPWQSLVRCLPQWNNQEDLAIP